MEGSFIAVANQLAFYFNQCTVSVTVVCVCVIIPVPCVLNLFSVGLCGDKEGNPVREGRGGGGGTRKGTGVARVGHQSVPRH